MFIFQKSEGVHPYLLKFCRGTCSFIGMLKGYMVRKKLGTPVVDNRQTHRTRRMPCAYSFIICGTLDCAEYLISSKALLQKFCYSHFKIIISAYPVRAKLLGV